jgi:two-component system, sensor histidine kinase and response regulator
MNKNLIKILLVISRQEDIPLSINFIQEKNLAIQKVTSTQEAIATAISPPDLILLDTTSDDIDEAEIYIHLKKQLINNSLTEVPIIFITDINKEFAILKNIDINYANFDYITKPLKQSELIVRLSQHIKIIQLKRELEDKNQQLCTEREIEQITTQLEITVSQAKLLERSKQARYAEAKLASAFRSSPDPIALATFPDIYYIEINDKFCHVFGYERSEVIGSSVTSLNIWVNPAECNAILRILRQERKIRNYEIQLCSANNEIKTMLLSAELIEIEDQQYLLGTARDITERKIAEAAQQLSEERLQFALEASDLGMWDWNLATGKVYRDWRWLKMLGYSAVEVNDTLDAFLQLVHPEDLQLVNTALEQYLLGITQVYKVEFRMRSKSGDWKWIESCGKIFDYNELAEPLRLTGTYKDITEQKTLERELAIHQARSDAFFNNAPVGQCIVNEQMCFVQVNELLAQMNGLSAVEHNGKSIYEIFPQIASIIEPIYQRVLATGESVLYQEISAYSRDDQKSLRHFLTSYFPIQGSDGRLSNVGTVIVEITDLKRATAALRSAAERERAITQVIQRMRQTLDLETIFSATTDQLRQVINCDRVVVYRFNPDWSGEFVAESVGSNWVSLINERNNNPNLTLGALDADACVVEKMNSNDNQVVDTYLQDTQGGAYNRGASFLCVPDIYNAGFADCYITLLEKFQAKAYITVPIFCGNKLWGLLACYQNNSKRSWETGEINIVVQISNQLGVALQQAELLAQTQLQSQALQQAAIAADAANRAKSEFLANMSHELRTPLNAILGFTQLMSHDNDLSEENQQDLNIINRAGEHLLNLINDILEMSKIEAGQSNLNITSFDLIILLDTLKEMLQFRATAKGLILTFEYDTNIPQNIQTDASKLRQVLLNLLGNAIKFTINGGVKLRVFARQTKQEGKDYLVFEVTDTGPGISPAEIELVFEAFGQTETGRAHQGTGLGLAISRKYVKMMGGEIILNSTLNVGSKFTFEIEILPALPDDISTNSIKSKIIGLALGQPTYRILVVDDAEDSRIFIVKLLSLIGFAVKEAVNGREAITIWNEWQPNLILMDLRMPMMDGYTATREIKLCDLQKHSSPLNRTVIIALTANVFSEQRHAILEAGCDDFINKPFREEFLLEKIKQHLRVEYIYQDITNQIAEETNNYQTLSDTQVIKALTKQSYEWIELLYQYAASCSDNLILDLLDQMPTSNISLKTFLQDLATSYYFEKIMELANSALNP